MGQVMEKRILSTLYRVVTLTVMDSFSSNTVVYIMSAVVCRYQQLGNWLEDKLFCPKAIHTRADRLNKNVN